MLFWCDSWFFFSYTNYSVKNRAIFSLLYVYCCVQYHNLEGALIVVFEATFGFSCSLPKTLYACAIPISGNFGISIENLA